jgi:hypothetical protein
MSSTSDAAKKNKREEAFYLGQEKKNDRGSGTSNTKHNQSHEITQHAGSWIAEINSSQQEINVSEPGEVDVFGEDSLDLLKITAEYYSTTADQTHQLDVTAGNYVFGVDLSEYMHFLQEETTPWSPYNRQLAG